MFRGHFFLRFLSFLLLLAILFGGGALLFRAGKSQGYALGLAASGKELTAPGTNPVPGIVPGYPYFGYGFYRPFFMPFLGPFGFFGGALFLLFIFFAISMVFRMAFGMMFWGRHGMWRGGPGHNGPWGWGSQSPDPKTPESQSSPNQSGEPKA